VSFHEGFDLPCFASFPLLGDGRGRAALRRYHGWQIGLLREAGVQRMTALTLTYPRGGDHRHVAEIIAAWDAA
jgi:hypothetical protein